LNNKSSGARPRGRPKSQEKADAIRTAAGDLFLSDGLAATSMDSIAEAAGVSKQTVYSHFASKDDLFRSCVVGKLDDYGLDASRIDGHTPITDQLRIIGRAYLTLLSDPDVIAMFRLMIGEASSFPQIAQVFYDSGPVATLEALSARMREHIPGVDAGIARTAAHEYLALVRSYYFLELLLGIRDPIDTNEIDEHVEHSIGQILKLYPLQDLR